MGLAAFNRMRRLKAQQEAEEAARLKALETQGADADKSLNEMPYQELRALAKEWKIEGYYTMNTEELREALKEGE